MVQRLHWYQPGLDDPDKSSNKGKPFKPKNSKAYNVPPDREQVEVGDERANLISSLTDAGTHMPAIDLDVPTLLIPSHTPGHNHLYINVEMPWVKYKNILWGLAKAGVLEQNYYQAAYKAHMSFLRLRPEERPDR
jgi:hypothetical protein